MPVLQELDYAITNPNAEDGDYTTGWTLDSGQWVRLGPGANAHEGDYYWSQNVTASGQIHQDIAAIQYPLTNTAIDTGEILIIFGYHGASYNGQDQAAMQLHFYDGTPGSLISSVDTGLNSAHGDSSGTNIWWPFHTSTMLPALTRTIRIELRAQRRNGTYLQGHMDSIFVKAFYAV